MDTSSLGTNKRLYGSHFPYPSLRLLLFVYLSHYMLSVLKPNDGTNNSSRGSSSMDMEDSAVHGTAAELSYQKQQQQQQASGVRPSLVRAKGFRHGHHRSNTLYDWRLFAPKHAGWRPWKYVRWCIVGGAGNAAESSEDRVDNLSGLAECLTLLRLYLELYGMPEQGGIKDQEMVLREICKDLYEGATPLWALEYVMQKAAEGLTGHKNVNWMLLPRKAVMFIPSTLTTTMFSMTRGFIIHKMEAMEPISVRLASFASNTTTTSNIPSAFPNPEELRQARQASTLSTSEFSTPSDSLRQWKDGRATQKELAKEILDLASEAQGLFFFINSKEYVQSTQDVNIDDFWKVAEEERELFTRLACMEAVEAIDQIDQKSTALYPEWMIIIFRVFASAGACAFWFNGSWYDMIVSGAIAVVIAAIGTSSILSKQERIVFEIIASFMAGLFSALVALSWPDQTCFTAMALAGVLDILQGFRVVYAVVQIMSKNTLAGSADLLEGILFTGLIAYFLRFGQYAAASMLNNEIAEVFTACENGIDSLWYILLVPLAAVSWSGLFAPTYGTLWPMCAHGCLAYSVNFIMAKYELNSHLNNFVSAAAVSLSSGIVSRYTGRQSVANTIAGLYVLLPGAYLVTGLYKSEIDGTFFIEIVERAVGIGIGAWTGSILCSPTLLGTTKGLAQQQEHGASARSRSLAENDRHNTMLMF